MSHSIAGVLLAIQIIFEVFEDKIKTANNESHLICQWQRPVFYQWQAVDMDCARSKDSHWQLEFD